MKKLFIINAQPGGNKGAEAMLETVILNLKGNGYQIYIEALNDSSSYGSFIRRMPVEIKLARFSPKNLLNPYNVEVKKDDVVIDIGGINYHDKSLKANIRNFIRHSSFIRNGAKLIFFTQDFGPAEKLSTKLLARYVYTKASKIFMRSTKSKELLTSLKNSLSEKIEGPFPDCTFMLKPVVLNESVTLPDNYFILAPSAIMYNEFGDEYLEEFVDTAKYLKEKFTPVVLVHNFTGNGGTSDKNICEKLFDNIITSGMEAKLVSEELSPSELKMILKNSKLNITSRYHVVVGSMSSGIPAFAIGWSHKYQEFLSLYGMGEYNLKYESGIIVNSLKNINYSDETKDKISCENTYLKERVVESFKLLKLSIS